MKYVPQIDSIRTLAVTFVIVEHWKPKEINFLFPIGSIGVDIFFVISGFLITGILLKMRFNIDLENDKLLKINAIKNFIIRRSLRIFPLYYLTLFLLFAGAKYFPNAISNEWPWFLTYMQNNLFFIKQQFSGGKVGHLWSLAVEEQFYLIWPWIIMYVRKKYLLTVLICGLIFGSLFSIILPNAGAIYKLSPVLLPCTLQGFCSGGILAYIFLFKKFYFIRFNKYINFSGLISLILYIIIHVIFPNFIHLDRILISFVTFWILYQILNNDIGIFSFYLNNRQVNSLGKMSYGIYVFHNFIPVLVSALLIKLSNFFTHDKNLSSLIYFIQNSPFSFYLISITILLLISYLSFYYFESKFLLLKNKFI